MKIFNAIGNMTLLLDTQHNILAANRATVTGLGKTKEELKGKKCYEIFHGTAQPPESCPLEKMLRSNSMETFEMVVEALNGTYLVSCTPLFDDNGNLEKVIHIATDITERKRVEKELIHFHDLMRYIIENSRSAVAVHDRDLKYIYVSQHYLDEYKVKEKDVIGKHHYDVFPDLPQKWRDVHQKVLAGEIISAEDDPYVREDGSVDWTRWECRPWYEFDGSIGGIIVYTEIINERKRAEEELKKHRDHLEELVKERTAELKNKNEELEKFNKLFVGRELRMVELKKIIVEKDKRISDLEKEIVVLKK